LIKKKIIQKFSASLLLLLFLLSNTPMQALHNLFANHVDSTKVVVDNDQKDQVKQMRFHCPTNHLVVESPFAQSTCLSIFNHPFFYLNFGASVYTFVTADCAYQPDLRGPPTV